MAWRIETEVSSSGFHERLISERQNQNQKNNDFKMNPSFLSWLSSKMVDEDDHKKVY